MSALMGLAIDTLFKNLEAAYQTALLNATMGIISWLEKLSVTFFDSAFVSQTLTFTKGIAWLILGAAFIITLLDIGEELGGYRPGSGGIEVIPIILQFFPKGQNQSKGGNKMAQSKTVKKTWDVDADAYAILEAIAKSSGRKMTQVVNEALRYYADRYYLEHKATMLPTEIIDAMNSTVSLLERRLDNRSNQLLSNMAVQLFIVNRVLADSLDISAEALEQYRSQAAEFIKANNRLLELREVV